MCKHTHVHKDSNVIACCLRSLLLHCKTSACFAYGLKCVRCERSMCIWSAFAHACARICGGNGYAVLGTFNTNMHACVCSLMNDNDNGEMPHTAAVVASIHILQVKHWWMFLRMVYASDDRNVHTTADNPCALLRDCLPGEDGGQKKGLLAFRCDIVEVWL